MCSSSSSIVGQGHKIDALVLMRVDVDESMMLNLRLGDLGQDRFFREGDETWMLQSD